jgi:hypothetical protein
MTRQEAAQDQRTHQQFATRKVEARGIRNLGSAFPLLASPDESLG